MPRKAMRFICLPPTHLKSDGPSFISSIRADAGRRPLELYKDVAETYGFILAGSNNSRNFSSDQGKAVNAIWQDTHARLETR